MNTKPALVTTAHRGVFVGILNDGDYEMDAKRIALNDVRNVIYWSGSRGFLGIASHGPEDGSRLGAMAPRIQLHDVTSVVDCTAEAWKACKEWK